MSRPLQLAMPARRKTRSRTAAPSADVSFSPAEVAAASRARKAAKVRTPPEVIDAFAPSLLSVRDVVFQPLTLGSLMVLERIGSPLADENFGPDTEVTTQDLMAVVLVLTRPPADSLAILGRGQDEWDRACLALASRFEPADIAALGLKLRETFTRAFATVISSEKKRMTDSPSIPPATGSAGG